MRGGGKGGNTYAWADTIPIILGSEKDGASAGAMGGAVGLEGRFVHVAAGESAAAVDVGRGGSRAGEAVSAWVIDWEGKGE